MAFPSSSLATPLPQLDEFYELTYDQLRTQFISDIVFPAIEVSEQSGTFGRIPLEEVLKTPPDLARQPLTAPWRDQMKFETDTYATQQYVIEELIDQRERQMYRHYLDAERAAAQRAAWKLLSARESRVAGILFNTTLYTGATEQGKGNGGWDTAGGTPVADVDNAKEKFYDNTGMYPNALVINLETFHKLRLNPQVTAQVASSGAGASIRTQDVNIEHMQAVFALPNVIVAGATTNTADINNAASVSRIWGPHASVCRIATMNADFKEPCIGRTFHWSQNGSAMSGTIEGYKDEQLMADVVRARHDVQEKKLYHEMGVLIKDVIS